MKITGTVESFHNPARDPLWPDLYAESARLEGGTLTLSERPGLGISFDEGSIHRHRQNYIGPHGMGTQD